MKSVVRLPDVLKSTTQLAPPIILKSVVCLPVALRTVCQLDLTEDVTWLVDENDNYLTDESGRLLRG